jgi:hypothetical protein
VSQQASLETGEAYVKKGLTLLSAHMSVGIAEDEANGREEITLPRPIAADDDIMLGREWLDDRLVFVAVIAT